MIELSDENRLNDHLWVDIEGYDEEGLYQTGCRIATPAEVAAAHPKCGTCEHVVYENDTRDSHYCYNHDSDMFCHHIDPALDYCRHHSQLTKEHDDDKPE